jgi:hypothetical protein
MTGTAWLALQLASQAAAQKAVLARFGALSRGPGRYDFNFGVTVQGHIIVAEDGSIKNCLEVVPNESLEGPAFNNPGIHETESLVIQRSTESGTNLKVMRTVDIADWSASHAPHITYERVKVARK